MQRFPGWSRGQDAELHCVEHKMKSARHCRKSKSRCTARVATFIANHWGFEAKLIMDWKMRNICTFVTQIFTLQLWLSLTEYFIFNFHLSSKMGTSDCWKNKSNLSIRHFPFLRTAWYRTWTCYCSEFMFLVFCSPGAYTLPSSFFALAFWPCPSLHFLSSYWTQFS